MELRLDKSVIKALSNDTRVSILKELRSRRYTQSELANNLSLSVPTIKEHLSALENAGLVEMHDEGRKWKYYALTKKSKGIFEPEQTNIFIILGTFILSVAGGVYTYVNSLKAVPMAGAPKVFAREAADEVLSVAQVATTAAADAVEVAPEPNYAFWIYLSIAILSLIIFIFFVVKRIKKKRLLGKYLNKK